MRTFSYLAALITDKLRKSTTNEIKNRKARKARKANGFLLPAPATGYIDGNMAHGHVISSILIV
jgi:hypothetical protein